MPAHDHDQHATRAHDAPGGEGGRYRSSWTQGSQPSARADAYGQRLPATGDEAARHEPYREHDDHYRRWRDEQARRMDSDYERWRRDRFERDFAQWRAIRAAQDGLRTGSGPPITHADRERELRGPEWPERWNGARER